METGRLSGWLRLRDAEQALMEGLSTSNFAEPLKAVK